MKKILLLTAGIVALCAGLRAQPISYVLLPGSSLTLAPGDKVNLIVQRYNVEGNPIGLVGGNVRSWTVNGQNLNSDPTTGNLAVDMTLESAVYTAPAAPPARNPVAVAITLQTADGPMNKHNPTITLICNITILKADYKITADFETTGPEGMHYKFKGECYTNLKLLPDGTLMLEPVDKTRQMKIDVDDAALIAQSTFIGPKEYYIPFLFSIGKINSKNPAPVSANIGFNTICPKQGAVEWVFHAKPDVHYTCDIDKGTITYSPGTTQNIVKPGSPLAMNSLTHLDIFQYFGMTQVQDQQNVNSANSEELIAVAKRFQANRTSQAYLNSAQGKADSKKMQTLITQIGHPTTNAQKQTQMLPGTARVSVTDTYDPKSKNPFNGTLQGSLGPIQSSISVKVEKLN